MGKRRRLCVSKRRGDDLSSMQRVKACCMMGLNRLVSASGGGVDDGRGDVHGGKVWFDCEGTGRHGMQVGM